MSKGAILDAGQELLAAIGSQASDIEVWRKFFLAYRFEANYPDDAYSWLSGILALKAAAEGNYGVGAILVDNAGKVLVQGHNEVLQPYFRSDLHAEMVVMNRFEDAAPPAADLSGHVLYTSLEPCPMCLVRLSASRIDTVLYAAADTETGMAHCLQALPPFWNKLVQRKTFTPARCSEALRGAAASVFTLSLNALGQRLKNP